MSIATAPGNLTATGRSGHVVVIASGDSAQQFAQRIAGLGHQTSVVDSPATAAQVAGLGTVDLFLVHADLAAGWTSPATSAPAVLLTPPGTVQGAVEPFLCTIGTDATADALQAVLSMAQALAGARAQVMQLESLVDGIRDGSLLVGNSPVVRRLQTGLSRAAETDVPVLVMGPRGSGKSLAARVIHCKSRRSNKPLHSLDCTHATAEQVSESIARSNGSSLLLEHVDRLTPPAQGVLVKHLKERNAVSAPRILVTSTSYLPELVARGAFREDLFYRLHAMPLTVPGLRERTGDLPLLAESILADLQGSASHTSAGFTPAAIAQLESMSWPGNVKQLEHVVRNAFLRAAGHAIDSTHVAAAPQQAEAVPVVAAKQSAARDAADESSIRPFEEVEKEVLAHALVATGGNVRRAAQLLGIGRATLYRKIQQFKLLMN
ncbi:MAG: hypothetical protein RL148_2164 [Planctomycetota bacterium]